MSRLFSDEEKRDKLMFLVSKWAEQFYKETYYIENVDGMKFVYAMPSYASYNESMIYGAFIRFHDDAVDVLTGDYDEKEKYCYANPVFIGLPIGDTEEELKRTAAIVELGCASAYCQ